MDLPTGVSFASGGSGFDPQTPRLTELYELGGKRLTIFGIPPIGCLPSQRTLAGGEVRECSESYNKAAQLYNTKLRTSLNSLNTNFNDSTKARVVYVDIYNPILDIIQNRDKYGSPF
ncbi:hypothetical protein U1Q18_006008 [Sarracenia purpurea var. burkii]